MNARSRRKVRRARARRWDTLGMNRIFQIIYASGVTLDDIYGPRYSLPTVEGYVPVRSL